MCSKFINKVVFLLAICLEFTTQNLQDDIRNQTSARKLLLRKRRYLVFPPGSSLQLVYCLTYPSVGIGQIFTFGSTAALAWELPTEPDQLFQVFGKKFATTSTTTPEPTWPSVILDHDPHEQHGDHSSDRIDSSSPERWSRGNEEYSRPVNPWKIYNDRYHSPISSRSYLSSYAHAKQENLNHNPVVSYLHPVYHQVHRRTRRDLYKKIEKLFTALSRDGRACILKTICEVTKMANRKGSFMEEVLKAIFQVKPHPQYPDEDHFDGAANETHDCADQYPTCKHSIFTNMF